MRYRIIVFLLVLSAQMMVFGQSPYDAFDKKQGEKHTYCLPEMVFRAENADTTNIVSYFELDIETLLLKCFAADGSLVEKIQLEQKDVKFISRDPKFEKYFWMSPYAYCVNNPLIFIDPNGKDVYQVDENGNSVGRIKNKNFDQFQVVSVDADGNKTVTASSEEYKYGTVIGGISNIETGKKDENGKPINLSIYGIKGSKEGESIHQFLSDNTNVEYGRWDCKSNLGEINVIGTSHQQAEENSGLYVKNFLSQNNWFGYLQTQDHNHPSGNNMPSGMDEKGNIQKNGDIPFIKSIEQKNPNVIFRVYGKGKGYRYYNSQGPY